MGSYRGLYINSAEQLQLETRLILGLCEEAPFKKWTPLTMEA